MRMTFDNLYYLFIFKMTEVNASIDKVTIELVLLNNRSLLDIGIQSILHLLLSIFSCLVGKLEE